MQIVRNDHSWHIADGSQTLQESLESLARQSGYRVADLSRHLGITEQHLRRLFHRDVGIPIKEWLRCERMMIARRMLNCDMDPSEISNSLGFTYPNSFSREFKTIYEMTVSDYLKTRQRRFEQWMEMSRHS